MGSVLCAQTQMEDRKNFRTGVDCQPQPQDVSSVVQPCPQFVQLEIWKLETAEESFVQGLCMLPSTSQKDS